MNNIPFLPEIINIKQYSTFNEFIDDLFHILYVQFFVDKIKFNGKIVKINQKLLVCNQNDDCASLEYTCLNCPFQGKFERFNHIVTGLNENTRTPGKYKESRAVRAHWIKPIIENVDNEKILYFKKGSKHYFWAKEDAYIVIVKENYKGDYYLNTAFVVDDKTYYKRYEREYENYNKSLTIFEMKKDSP